jgi:hypothetical protein
MSILFVNYNSFADGIEGEFKRGKSPSFYYISLFGGGVRKL